MSERPAGEGARDERYRHRANELSRTMAAEDGAGEVAAILPSLVASAR